MRIGDVHRGGGRSPGQRAMVMPKGAGRGKKNVPTKGEYYVGLYVNVVSNRCGWSEFLWV